MGNVRNVSLAEADQGIATAEPSLAELITSVYARLRRQFLLIAGGALLGLILGIFYLFVAPPGYTAQAEILFDRGNRPVVTQQSIIADSTFDTSFFDSQIKILLSDDIALQVVRKLGLANDPSFGDDARGAFGKIASGFSALMRSTPLSEADKEKRAATAILQKLDAKRVGVTFFVEITYQANSGFRAEQIVNAVAASYIADQMAVKVDVTKRANAWLQERLTELGRQAAADERAVNAYKAEHKIVSIGGASMGDQALTELNRELVAGRAKISEAAARLERIEAVLRMGNLDASVTATVSDTLNDPIITKLRQDLLALVSRLSEYSARYGDRHLAVVSLKEKIRNLQASILSQVGNLAESSRSEYIIAKKRQEDIERELASSVSQSQATDRAQVALRELESAAQSSRSLYNSFQQRFIEAAQQQSYLFSEVRLAKPASVTSQKRGPKVLALALFGGLLAGVGLGMLREVMDGVFRVSEQVKDILHLPCVALVPFVASAPLKQAQPPTVETLPRGPRTIEMRSPSVNAALEQRFSPFTEAIRSIKLAADLNIKFLSDDHGAGAVIGMTSSWPNEGKSTLALALGQFSARLGRRVIILDFDFRHPSLTRLLAPQAKTGVVEVLSEQRKLSDTLWTDPRTGMAFLPGVTNAHLIDGFDILMSPLTEQLLRDLRRDYDYVIVDLPPMLPVSDVRATAHLIDIYFLVIEWGRTKIDVVRHGMDAASGVHEKIAGAILNKVDLDYISRYENYHGAEYYNRTEA
jgi:polysaccharide biosynthesis transport protein